MTFPKPITKFFTSNIFLILVLVISILLRIPSLFEPNHYADEDIYLTLGQGLRHGLVFYRDIHDNKPPFIYLIAAIANNITNFKIILFIWNLVNLILAWFLSQKLFKSKKIAFITSLLFAVFSAIPFIEGNIVNGEIFMIMPVTAAILLLFSKKINYFLSGILFSLGFLFKIPVAFEFLGIIFWLTFIQSKTFLNGLKKLFSKDLFWFYFGFILPVIISLIYYFFVGAGKEYIKAAFLQNLGYLSSWENHPRFYQTDLFYRSLILAFIFLLIYLFRRHLSDKIKFILIWFFSALFGALLSNRPYPHYLIEVIIPASFFIGIIFSQEKIYSKIISLVSLSTLIFIFNYLNFWHYDTLSYYRNFIDYQTGKINKTQFYEYFGKNVTEDQAIAAYIKQSTKNNDRLFVWGTEPALYVLSHRLPIGRYTVAYHIIDFNGYQETIDAFKANLPKFVVYYPMDNHPFEELDSLLQRYYSLDQVFDSSVLIFQKR